jgi:hypothetical protein
MFCNILDSIFKYISDNSYLKYAISSLILLKLIQITIHFFRYTLNQIKILFLTQSRIIFHRYFDKDSYVVVTGGSSGIGKEYCFAFAKMNFNLIIISNELEALKEVE